MADIEITSGGSLAHGFLELLTKPPNILLVEDDGHYAEMFLIQLSHYNCNLCRFSDGTSAIEYLNTGTSVDLLFLDLKLPGASGLDVLKVAKETHPNLPVAIITGCADSEDAKEAMKSGIVIMVTKPVTTAEFNRLFSMFKIRALPKGDGEGI